MLLFAMAIGESLMCVWFEELHMNTVPSLLPLHTTLDDPFHLTPHITINDPSLTQET